MSTTALHNLPADHKALVVFEGIDNSGKTTVSKKLVQLFDGFTWTKEPTFSTEQADRLNSPECTDENYRESLFLESRLGRQDFYKEHNCFLDRYIWSGMAYANVYSPGVFPFAKVIYRNYNLFKKPDLVFFMDTPVDLCQFREPSLSIDELEKRLSGYQETEHLVDYPIVHVDGTMSVEQCVEFCKDKMLEYFGGTHGI